LLAVLLVLSDGNEAFVAGKAAYNAKDYAKAEPLFRAALNASEASDGSGSVAAGDCHLWLGHTLSARHQPREALAAYQRSLTIYREKVPGNVAVISWVHLQIGHRKVHLTDYDGAVADYEWVVRLAGEQLAAEPKRYVPRLVWGLANIGNCHARCGRFAQAEPFYRRALAAAEKGLAADDLVTNWAVHQLASFHSCLGQDEDARPLFRRCIRSLRGQDYGSDTTLVNALTGLALMARKEDEAAAEPLYAEAVAIGDRIHGPGGSGHYDTLSAYAQTLLRLGRARDAERVAARMLANCARETGPTSFRSSDAKITLGQAYAVLGRFADAERLLGEAYEFFRKGTSFNECKH
ncbi:MAG: tetratricopeptide repeat protein, partial [Gemmataceae bacterium]